MADFKQAVEWMKEGKKIKHKDWNPGQYCYFHQGKVHDQDHDKSNIEIDCYDDILYGWELYEEELTEKKVQDMINDYVTKTLTKPFFLEVNKKTGRRLYGDYENKGTVIDSVRVRTNNDLQDNEINFSNEEKESCADFLKRIGTDGKKWAKEFMKLWGDKKGKIDESLMIGWFCNAIEAGKDSVPSSPLISGGLSFATDESMNVGYERKCEADNLLLLTQPPQSKCKNCGNTWFDGAAIPNCNYVESLSDKLVTPFGFDGDWAKAEDIRESVDKIGKNILERFDHNRNISPSFSDIKEIINEEFGDRLIK